LEPKRFIGSDLRRLYDRIRNDFGPDAVIIRTRSLMRKAPARSRDPCSRTRRPGDFRSMCNRASAVVCWRDSRPIRNRSRGRPRRPGGARRAGRGGGPPGGSPSPEAEPPPPDWLRGFVANAPTGPATVDLAGSATPPTGEEGEAQAAIEGSLRSFQVPSIDEALARSATTRSGRWPPRPCARARQLPATRVPVRPARIRQTGVPRTSTTSSLPPLGRGRPHRFPDRFVEGDHARALAATLEQRHVRYPDELQTAVITMQGPVGAGQNRGLVRMALDCADAGREAMLVAPTPRTWGRAARSTPTRRHGPPRAEAFDRRDVARVAAKARPGTCVFVDLPSAPGSLQKGSPRRSSAISCSPPIGSDPRSNGRFAPFTVTSLPAV